MNTLTAVQKIDQIIRNFIKNLNAGLANNGGNLP